LQQSLLAVLKARFPQAPIALIEDIERIHERDALRSLLVAAAQASTIEEFVPHLKQAAREAAQQEPLS
jgi:hypothetical protein